MDILKFNLSGNTAFFKKPDVNSAYFTYGQIHKIALLGILGAIMGYNGYNQQNSNEVFPEFYEKLQQIKVAIVPKGKNGYIAKKFQKFNNSVGYGYTKKGGGGNLVVKEQWLEKPSWDIYILVKTEQEKELMNRIINHKTIYIPYLGKNDHFANIQIVETYKDVVETNNPNKIDSLFALNRFEIVPVTEDWSVDVVEKTFLYQEMLPVSLEETTNSYRYDLFAYTNSRIKQIEKAILYRCGEKDLYFY